MPLKFGKCRLCPKNSPDKRLYGDGVCAYHLQHAEDDESKKRIERQISDLRLSPHELKLLNQYYKDQVELVPEFCENQCGKRLFAVETWRIKALVCHIVPKNDFRSVMLHPANTWYGCLHCHHDYDDKGWTHAVTMPVWRLCAQRFTQFMHLIKDSELPKLPDAFRVLMQ